MHDVDCTLCRQGVGGRRSGMGRLGREELTRQEGRRDAAARPAAARRARGHAARRLWRLPQAPGEAPCLADLKREYRWGQVCSHTSWGTDLQQTSCGLPMHVLSICLIVYDLCFVKVPTINRQ